MIQTIRFTKNYKNRLEIGGEPPAVIRLSCTS